MWGERGEQAVFDVESWGEKRGAGSLLLTYSARGVAYNAFGATPKEKAREEEKMQTLYADVLFFVNFCMDFLALWLVGSLFHRERRILPLFFASVLGAAYALFDTLYPMHSVLAFFLFFGVGATMTLIAYGGESAVGFLRLFLSFLVVSILLGGMITVFYSRLSALVGSDALPLRKSDILLTLGGISGLLILAAKRFFFRTRSGKTVSLSLTVGERTLSVSGLLDSGNLLSDPVSGLPVILLRRSVAMRLLPQGYRMPNADAPRFDRRPPHMYPVFVEGVGGREMMWAFQPDRILLSSGRSELALTAALAVDMRDTPYGSCDALVPTSISV